MRHTAAGLILLLLSCLAPPLPAAEQDSGFFFHRGDRVLFLGDSITEQYQYSTYIELYLTTRFPDWDLTFLNAGISGDTATGGARRFAAHVLAEKPTAVTIDFGMNDGGYGAFHPRAAANYLKQTEAMLRAAQEAHVRVALISPNAVEVSSKPGLKTYLETQKRFYAPLKELAERYHVPFVDQYAVTRKVLEKMAADRVPVRPFPDGIHTSPAGALLMAHTILVGLKAPALVSDVQVDAGSREVKADHCTVRSVEGGATGLSFERTDQALPLPVQKEWLEVLPYLDRLRDLNYYGLKVTGLKEGRYTLRIDGHDVGTYSADRWARGVNLGNLTTGPIHDQGQKVFQAINAKNDLLHRRFREVVMYSPPNWVHGADEAVNKSRPEELKKRMEQINARQKEIDKLAQPVAHHFELQPAHASEKAHRDRPARHQEKKAERKIKHLEKKSGTLK